jgi:cytochrome c-type biogenesis protein CcmH/NrfF
VKPRRLLALAAAVALLAVTGLAVWRSTTDTRPPADRVAASLRCPTCEGETVANSRSPVAAAMRGVIAQQLAAGRSPDQVRDWFVQRYGAEVLADPSPWGAGVLLWVLPAGVLLAAVGVAIRTVRRRAEPGAARPGTAQPGIERPGAAEPGTERPAPASRREPASADPARRRRAWDLVAVGVVGMVAAVAVAGTRTGQTATTAASTGSRPTPSAAPSAQLGLAQSLEQQGDYAAAADIYRAAVRANPDPQLQLRLAFTLLRAGQHDQAADTARRVLADRPADPDAVLVLGLAERAAHSPAADSTLRRFLRLAPDHPAAADVRRLVARPTGRHR